ncbi:MAG: ribonuclease P protein component [Verrucomicrobia bacterium]|nr:MAG: ribonuclease P protein component [Verrucomicrobiota bacterium]
MPRQNGLKKRSPGAETASSEGAQTTDGEQRVGDFRDRSGRFRPDQRIRRRGEFQHLYTCGTRIRARYSTFFVLPNELDVGRLGIAATKKLGGAVQRNRAKRLIR